MLHAASTLANEKSRKFSVKNTEGISLQVLIKHGTVLGHGTPKFASQLPLVRYKNNNLHFLLLGCFTGLH